VLSIIYRNRFPKHVYNLSRIFLQKICHFSKKHRILRNLFFDITLMEQKRDADLLRVNKKTILFNNRELKAIENYCRKYRVNNRSKFMREAVITFILKKLDEDYPSLF